jgi:hypothetical protein
VTFWRVSGKTKRHIRTAEDRVEERSRVREWRWSVEGASLVDTPLGLQEQKLALLCEGKRAAAPSRLDVLREGEGVL